MALVEKVAYGKFQISPEGWWLVNPMLDPSVAKSTRGDWGNFWLKQPLAVLDIADYRGGDPGKRQCALIHVGGKICWADIVTGALYDARRGVGLTTPTRTFIKPKGHFLPARQGPLLKRQRSEEWQQTHSQQELT